MTAPLSPADLYDRDGLIRMDAAFLAHAAALSPDIHAALLGARANPDAVEAAAESALILALSPLLDDFLGIRFGIAAEVGALRAGHQDLAPLYRVKRLFVQRTAVKAHGAAAGGFDVAALTAALEARLGAGFDETAFATAVEAWQTDEAAHAEALDLAARYAAAMSLAPPEGSILFKAPLKLAPESLVPLETVVHDGVAMLRLSGHHRPRDGFGLTDAGMGLAHALDQANYCIWCHHQGRDSCSKGLREKDGAFKKSVFGVTLAGCPLDEKISELNETKAAGWPLAALAIVCVDNPMCAATGHRICNDCMKACVFQKQSPVDIPQIESRTLKDVLALPYGFEIYSLLTRWNPLNIRRPLPRPDSGRTVLVAGMGPAGFTLAHHLMQDGHRVLAIDGLKIEPLAGGLAGAEFALLRDASILREPLDRRVQAGFGGVAEYGITVRWDKNFLKTIRLLLERRDRFTLVGGVRLGGTITIEQAFAAGIDHVALCLGAGRPTVLSIPNGLARGVRQASDFLMALQLTGAARAESIANLQLRLPVVVVGGGLTAIDTATEAMAYYPVQVEKFLERIEALGDRAPALLSAEEQEVAEEFTAHARAFRAERAAAAAAGRRPDFAGLIDRWGGVTIAYRRRMIDSPSYTLNHEEVALGLEEGIRFAENLTPKAVEIDAHGHTAAVVFAHPDGERRLPARALLVAAGTTPNTVLAREEPVPLNGKYFATESLGGAPVSPEKLAKPAETHVLVKRIADGRAVSMFGDLHPSFAGNVVKAMGSAKRGHPLVTAVLSERPAKGCDVAAIAADLSASVRAVNILTPTIVEVVLHAPAAARNFKPGQFYRLQNFEAHSRHAGQTLLAMEGLAMTGAWVKPEEGLIAVIALEMGGSSNLCRHLIPGEPVVLMGPTGAPTEVEPGETVLLAGGGLGNAVLFSIGRAIREAGGRVLYFAGYRNPDDVFKPDAIEDSADQVIWCADRPPAPMARRPQDASFTGNIVAAMAAYGEGRLGEGIPLGDVDRIIAIGSDRMMAAVQKARHAVLKPYLKPGHEAIGSINSPMQCMMKEICAQCLQRHVDPETGAETIVFTCQNQDQPLDHVDFANLNDRLRQNSLAEKVTAAWIRAATAEG